MEIEKKAGRIFVALVTLVLVVQAAAGVLIFRSFPTWQDRASFGSMFDAVGALFSGLALVGVIYAVLLQRNELFLQRQELDLTRQELAKSARAQQDTAALMTKQFELAAEAARLSLSQSLAETAPIFKWSGGSLAPGRATAKVVNVGALARDIVVTGEGLLGSSFNPPDVLAHDSSGTLEVLYQDPAQPPFELEFHFDDGLGRRRSEILTFDPEQGRLKSAHLGRP